MPISKELIQQLREMAMIDKGGWCSMAAVEFTQKHMKALLDEIERLTHLHDLDHSLVDQKQAEIERLQGERHHLIQSIIDMAVDHGYRDFAAYLNKVDRGEDQ